MKKIFTLTFLVGMFLFGSSASAKINHNDKIISALNLLDKATTLSMDIDDQNISNPKFFKKSDQITFDKNKNLRQFLNNRSKSRITEDSSDKNDIFFFLSSSMVGGSGGSDAQIVQIGGYRYARPIIKDTNDAVWVRSTSTPLSFDWNKKSSLASASAFDDSSLINALLVQTLNSARMDFIEYVFKNHPSHVIIKKLADENLAGHSTNHYLVKLNNKMNADYAEYHHRLATPLAGDGIPLFESGRQNLKDVQYNIWIDKNTQHPVKISFKQKILYKDKEEIDNRIHIRTIDFISFDEPVNIYAPTNFVDSSSTSK